MSVETVKDFAILKLFRALKIKCKNRLHLLKYNKNGTIIIRSDIVRLKEAALFIEHYQSLTRTRYKALCNQRKPFSGFLFHKEWNCHLAEADNCPSKISIYSKKSNRMQKATDEFLRLSTPLPAVIKINRQHNHIPPKIGKIPKEICDMYFKYFNEGIKGIKAKRLHEKNLQIRKVEAAEGSPLNPRMTTVYTLYQKWKKLKKNAEINKVPTCDSGPHASSGIDSTYISQDIKIEPVDEEEEYDSPSNMSNEVGVKTEDADEENDNCLDLNEIMYQQQEINVKMEHPNEEDINCPNFNQILIHQREVMVEIEEIVEQNNCPNTACSFSNSQENQLKGMDKKRNYNSRIQKRASNSKVNQKCSKNRNKLKSPKIVNSCSLKTGSQNNAMPSTSVVTNSNSYYISVQTNNFVNIINPPPVPLIMNMPTNVNTNVVCPVQRAVSINNSHMTLYNPLSNTYTVVQLCLPTSPTVSPSNLYSAHFPSGILSPTRVGVNKF